jgi:hypothetical protein
MYRTLDMVIQTVEGSELSCAEIAFVGPSIPGAIRGNGLHVRISGETNHRTGDDIVAIELVDHLIDFLAIEAGGSAFA